MAGARRSSCGACRASRPSCSTSAASTPAIPLRERAGRARRAVPRGRRRSSTLQARERGVDDRASCRRPARAGRRGDPGAVARVVRILLDNAAALLARAASPVRVVAAYHGEHATVEVCDRGPGRAPADRELHLRALPARQRAAAARAASGSASRSAASSPSAWAATLGLDDGRASRARGSSCALPDRAARRLAPPSRSRRAAPRRAPRYCAGYRRRRAGAARQHDPAPAAVADDEQHESGDGDRDEQHEADERRRRPARRRGRRSPTRRTPSRTAASNVPT